MQCMDNSFRLVVRETQSVFLWLRIPMGGVSGANEPSSSLGMVTFWMSSSGAGDEASAFERRWPMQVAGESRGRRRHPVRHIRERRGDVGSGRLLSYCSATSHGGKQCSADSHDASGSRVIGIEYTSASTFGQLLSLRML